MHELIGKTLGKYRVVTHLGRGGMAEVYKAYQAGLDRYVAIKVLRYHDADEADFVKRFEREAAAVARLRHANIVQVYDFDSEGDLHYMVMEFVDGPTLKAELQQRRANSRAFTLRETARLFGGLAAAVDYAHSHGMIHRDLKPANIMFNADGHVVLTDFGVALILGAMHYTLTGALSGTPAYMSPEQGQGQSGDERSDIYSLGVILYELVTGRIPFDADTPVAIMIKHMNDPLPLARTVNPNVSEAVERVILKALSKKPEDRYSTAGEMAKALREAAGATIDSKPASLPINVTSAQPKTASASAKTSSAPYRGLLAFREEDAPFFFGRETFIERLVEAVNVSHKLMVAVIGPSGSGKSSVVSAGLLPRLRQATLRPSPVSAVLKDQGNNWLATDFRPGAQPFRSLAAALIPKLESQLDKPTFLVETRKLAEALQRGEIGLHDIVERVLRKNAEAGRLLLFADQFEELYTLCPDPDVRHRFLDMLLEAVNAQSHRREPALTLVFTLRADFLEHLLTHRNFADAVQNAAFVLGPMNRHEMEHAIENPALKQGLTLEAGLTERLLDEALNKPDGLPRLEFALTCLYDWQAAQGQQTLTQAAYEAVGRVDEALEQYAEETYDSLNEIEKERSRQIFMQLVHLGEHTSTGDTRRVATRAELGEAGWALAHTWAAAKLIVTGENAEGQAIAEIVHETLIPNWRRLRGWINADQAFQRWRARLEPTLIRWETHPADSNTLLNGAALVEAEDWFTHRSWDLTAAEQKLIQASLARREREETESEAERQREILAAQKSAEAEKQRADEQTQATHQLTRRLRLRTLALVGALVVTGLLALVAFGFGLQARQQAIQNQQRADATLTQVSAEKIQAQTQADLAATQIVAAQAQTQLADSRKLAAAAIENLKIDPELSLLLALQAAATADTVEAEIALYQTVQPETLTLSGFSGQIKSLAYSSDKSRLATASTASPKTTKIWDITSSEVLSGAEGLTLTGHTGQVLTVAFSPDGKLVATGSADETAKVWDISTALNAGSISGEDVLTLTGHTDQILAVAFSPDGKQLTTASADQSVKVWDSVSGQNLRTLSGHTDQVVAVTYSPDGKQLAIASADQTVKIWDISSDEMVWTLTKVGQVSGLAFNSDGTRLMTVNSEGSIQVWAASSGERLYTLPTPAGTVSSLAFSPSGTHLAIAHSDGTVSFYPLKLEDLMALAKTQTTRALTPEECQKYLQGEACP